MALAGVSACAVDAYPPTVAGYATVYADGVPADIYAYPHIYYGGSYAYLVGERWYYPSRAGWVVLRQEPPELYRYRLTYPPPGYRPEYRPSEPRHYAPPAPYAYPPPGTRER